MSLDLKNFFRNHKGFILLEFLVALSVFIVIIMVSGSLYVMSQRVYDTSEDKMELAQNGRVAFDRITREIRQSVAIATPLATSSSEATEEMMFQDGHNSDQITYIFYYLNGNELRRAKLVYFFEEEPDIYVKYNSTNEEGELPESKVLEDKVVGEYFKGVGFWEENGLIHASSTLENNDQNFKINTSVFSRN